jgi:hypothetical protein
MRRFISVPGLLRVDDGIADQSSRHTLRERINRPAA